MKRIGTLLFTLSALGGLSGLEQPEDSNSNGKILLDKAHGIQTPRWALPTRMARRICIIEDCDFHAFGIADFDSAAWVVHATDEFMGYTNL